MPFAIRKLHPPPPVGQDLDDHARSVDVVPELHSHFERVRTCHLLLDQAHLGRMLFHFHVCFCEDRLRIRMMARAGFRSLRRWRIARQRPGRERGVRLLRHWGRRLKQLPRAQQPNRLMNLAARNRTRASIPRDHFYLSK